MHGCPSLCCQVSEFDFQQSILLWGIRSCVLHFHWQFPFCTLESLLQFPVFPSIVLSHNQNRVTSGCLCLNVLAHALNKLNFLVVYPSKWDSCELINSEISNLARTFFIFVHFQGGTVMEPPAIYHCSLYSS
jgi:hypothetical protein